MTPSTLRTDYKFWKLSNKRSPSRSPSRTTSSRNWARNRFLLPWRAFRNFRTFRCSIFVSAFDQEKHFQTSNFWVLGWQMLWRLLNWYLVTSIGYLFKFSAKDPWNPCTGTSLWLSHYNLQNRWLSTIRYSWERLTSHSTLNAHSLKDIQRFFSTEQWFCNMQPLQIML